MTPLSRFPATPNAGSAASPIPAQSGPAWRPFAIAFAATAAASLLTLYGIVYALDPYGLRTGATRAPTPIMDINQRYMYPQLARSGRFEAALFGTSTVRLLDPASLAGALGGRVANLGLNAGTPWEQLELARLFLRHQRVPTALVFGLDRSWCDPAADAAANRLTFRSFPPWLYDEAWWNDLPGLLSLKSLEVAGRVALHRLGLMPARIREDGYEVFTPPDASYDLTRARSHLRAGLPDGPAAITPYGPGALRTYDPALTPALDWLAEFVMRVPANTRLVFLFPPVHALAQAEPGSPEERVDEACKRKVVAIASPRQGLVLDFRRRTSLTNEDANYWDRLHVREPVARRVAEGIAAATAGREPPDDSYRVLSR